MNLITFTVGNKKIAINTNKISFVEPNGVEETFIYMIDKKILNVDGTFEHTVGILNSHSQVRKK